jgi:hypothetical protein
LRLSKKERQDRLGILPSVMLNPYCGSWGLIATIFLFVFFLPGFGVTDAALGTLVIKHPFAWIDLHDKDIATLWTFNRLSEGMLAALGAVQDERSHHGAHLTGFLHFLDFTDGIISHLLATGALERNSFLQIGTIATTYHAVKDGDQGHSQNNDRENNHRKGLSATISANGDTREFRLKPE